MNWRALGCGLVAAGAFILLGVVSILRVGAPAECPATLPYQPASYHQFGEPTSEPMLEGVDEPLERAGTASFGLASWDVLVEPGRAPAASGESLPPRIVLDCRDGTFQAYQRGSG